MAHFFILTILCDQRLYNIGRNPNCIGRCRWQHGFNSQSMSNSNSCIVYTAHGIKLVSNGETTITIQNSAILLLSINMLQPKAQKDLCSLTHYQISLWTSSVILIEMSEKKEMFCVIRVDVRKLVNRKELISSFCSAWSHLRYIVKKPLFHCHGA